MQNMATQCLTLIAVKLCYPGQTSCCWQLCMYTQLLPLAWHTNLYGGDMHCTIALIMSVCSDKERTLRKGDLPVYINIFRVVQHFQTLPKPEETQ